MSEPRSATSPHRRFRVVCRQCERVMYARAGWTGWEVSCPYCHSSLRVPEPPEHDEPVPGEPPRLAPKYGFNFVCPRCTCLLEANTGMSGVLAVCPTCAARVRVPHVSRSGRVGKAELIDEPADVPAPAHAYAASGHQAPRFVETADGTAAIRCPRCNANNAVDADACAACGTPFTMEAAPTVGSLRRRQGSRTALTLGIVGLLLFPLALPSVLAIVIGLRTVFAPASGAAPTGAWIGIGLGVCGIIGALLIWLV